MTVQALFLASWERSGGTWIARHGLTAAQYQAAFDQHVGQGFRLRAVSGYSVNGAPAFAAILDKTGGPAWAARHGLTGVQHQQQALDQFAQQGYPPALGLGFNGK